jgi:hypothetical protein
MPLCLADFAAANSASHGRRGRKLREGGLRIGGERQRAAGGCGGSAEGVGKEEHGAVRAVVGDSVGRSGEGTAATAAAPKGVVGEAELVPPPAALDPVMAADLGSVTPREAAAAAAVVSLQQGDPTSEPEPEPESRAMVPSGKAKAE